MVASEVAPRSPAIARAETVRRREVGRSLFILAFPVPWWGGSDLTKCRYDRLTAIFRGDEMLLTFLAGHHSLRPPSFLLAQHRLGGTGGFPSPARPDGENEASQQQ